MESTRKSDINQNATFNISKWSASAAVMLLSASLLLSACGDSPEPVVVSTPVATLAAPAAETPAAETPEAEVEATPTVSDSETMTDTDTMTDTEGMDDSETMTDTEGMDDSDTMTDTDIMTDTEGMDDSETMTDTEGMDDSETMTETGAVENAHTMPMMGVTGVDPQQYVRATTLLDYDFENLDGEVSGDLEDLLIDLSTGRVLFAAVEYGGVLDLGDTDIVIPLNAFSIGAEGELILNIDETSLENYPDVGNDWPDLNDPVWDDDVNSYWTETGIDIGAGFDEPTTSVAWASDLLGHNIADLGIGAGSVLDILVNLGTGHAPFLIVDYGEGLDTDPYVIPLSAYDVSNWSADTELAYGPDFTPDILDNAPRFDRDTYPEGTPLDRDFGDRIESAWNDLGFSHDLNRDNQID